MQSTRKSTITTQSDSAGEYEQEIFVAENPAFILLGVHGNGVRRWDGEKFYYQVADEFEDAVVGLVDQNQVESDGCKLNSMDVIIERNQKLLKELTDKYPNLPVCIVAHSMGCGVASMMNLTSVEGVVFVAPAVGAFKEKYVERYGEDIINGKIVRTSDGLHKNLSKEFINSVWDIDWKDKYSEMLKRFSEVFVFESGDDEIIELDLRQEIRNLPFASYEIIDGAKHNFSGKHSAELFTKIKSLLPS